MAAAVQTRSEKGRREAPPACRPWRPEASWLRRLCGPWVGVHYQYPPRKLDLEFHPAHAVDPRLPSIAIVTPSFNQGRFLERTLRSVLDQSYPNIEYAIQDGGSSDDTAAVLRRYADRLTHVATAPDDGQADAINKGFVRCNGEIMAYLNSDDLLLPGSLERVGSYFSVHPEVDAVYGHRIVIDENDAEVGRWIMPPHEDGVFLWNNYLPQETLFWRRSMWQKVGGRFDSNLHYAFDRDLLLRFRTAQAKFVRLPRFLGAFRVHSEQKTEKFKLDLGISEQQIVRERFHGRPVSTIEAKLRATPYLSKQIVYQRLYQIGLLKTA